MHRHYGPVGLDEKQGAAQKAFGHLTLVPGGDESGDQSGDDSAPSDVKSVDESAEAETSSPAVAGA